MSTWGAEYEHTARLLFHHFRTVDSSPDSQPASHISLLRAYALLSLQCLAMQKGITTTTLIENNIPYLIVSVGSS